MSRPERENVSSSRTRALIATVIGAALLSWLPASAWANTSCSGSINFLGADNAGNVYVDLGYGVWEVCNLSQAFTANGLTVTTDSCKAWYASFLAAQKAGTNATLYFYSATECASYGTWVTPSPYFVQPQ